MNDRLNQQLEEEKNKRARLQRKAKICKQSSEYSQAIDLQAKSLMCLRHVAEREESYFKQSSGEGFRRDPEDSLIYLMSIVNDLSLPITCFLEEDKLPEAKALMIEQAHIIKAIEENKEELGDYIEEALEWTEKQKAIHSLRVIKFKEESSRKLEYEDVHVAEIWDKEELNHIKESLESFYKLSVCRWLNKEYTGCSANYNPEITTEESLRKSEAEADGCVKIGCFSLVIIAVIAILI